MKWFDLLWRLAQVAMGSVQQELERWRWQLFQSLLLVLLTAVCALAVLLLAALLVVLTYWETHRLEALWSLLLVYSLLAVWMLRRAGRLMTRPPAAAYTSRRWGGDGCAGCSARSGSTCRGQ